MTKTHNSLNSLLPLAIWYAFKGICIGCTGIVKVLYNDILPRATAPPCPQ